MFGPNSNGCFNSINIMHEQKCREQCHVVSLGKWCGRAETIQMHWSGSADQLTQIAQPPYIHGFGYGVAVLTHIALLPYI